MASMARWKASAIAREVHALGAGEHLEGVDLRGGDDDAGVELARACADGVDL
jgi:hypothetical protein